MVLVHWNRVHVHNRSDGARVLVQTHVDGHILGLVILEEGECEFGINSSLHHRAGLELAVGKCLELVVVGSEDVGA